jgi:hypothetical protein
MDRRPAGEMEIPHTKGLTLSLIFSDLQGLLRGASWHIQYHLCNAWLMH